MPELTDELLEECEQLHSRLVGLAELAQKHRRERARAESASAGDKRLPEEAHSLAGFVALVLWTRYRSTLKSAKLPGRGTVDMTVGEAGPRHRKNLFAATWELTVEYMVRPKIDGLEHHAYVRARLPAMLDEMDKDTSGRYDKHGALVIEASLDAPVTSTSGEQETTLLDLVPDDESGIRAGIAADAPPPTRDSITHAMETARARGVLSEDVAAASQPGVHGLADAAERGDLEKRSPYSAAYAAELALGATRDEARRTQARGMDAAEAAKEIGRAMASPPAATPAERYSLRLAPAERRTFVVENLIAGQASIVSASQVDPTTFAIYAVSYRNVTRQFFRALDDQAKHPTPSGFASLDHLMRQRT